MKKTRRTLTIMLCILILAAVSVTSVFAARGRADVTDDATDTIVVGEVMINALSTSIYAETVANRACDSMDEYVAVHASNCPDVINYGANYYMAVTDADGSFSGYKHVDGEIYQDGLYSWGFVSVEIN